MNDIKQLNPLTKSKHELIHEYIELYDNYLKQLPIKKVQMETISGINRFNRSDARYLSQFNHELAIGDVCYIDFGQAYTYEAGFQHFGVIMNIIGNKVFVIPMTSNEATYKKADPTNNYPIPELFQLKDVKGLYKASVCFLHDAKFINKARVISIKAHIGVNTTLFKQLKERMIATITQ